MPPSALKSARGQPVSALVFSLAVLVINIMFQWMLLNPLATTMHIILMKSKVCGNKLDGKKAQNGVKKNVLVQLHTRLVSSQSQLYTVSLSQALSSM